MDLSQREIRRQVNGTDKVCTARGAMMERAKGGQWRGDVPPESPGEDWNRQNPDPGKVFYTDEFNQLQSRDK